MGILRTGTGVNDMDPKTLDTLAVAHDFAPGAGPTASERMASSFLTTLVTDEMGLLLLGAVVAVALAVTLLAMRADRTPRRRDPELAGGGTVDLRALRRARTAAGGQG